MARQAEALPRRNGRSRHRCAWSRTTGTSSTGPPRPARVLQQWRVASHSARVCHGEIIARLPSGAIGMGSRACQRSRCTFSGRVGTRPASADTAKLVPQTAHKVARRCGCQDGAAQARMACDSRSRAQVPCSSRSHCRQSTRRTFWSDRQREARLPAMDVNRPSNGRQEAGFRHVRGPCVGAIRACAVDPRALDDQTQLCNGSGIMPLCDANATLSSSSAVSHRPVRFAKGAAPSSHRDAVHARTER